jgi:hypothetical protein
MVVKAFVEVQCVPRKRGDSLSPVFADACEEKEERSPQETENAFQLEQLNHKIPKRDLKDVAFLRRLVLSRWQTVWDSFLPASGIGVVDVLT